MARDLSPVHKRRYVLQTITSSEDGLCVSHRTFTLAEVIPELLEVLLNDEFMLDEECAIYLARTTGPKSMYEQRTPEMKEQIRHNERVLY